MKSKRRLKREFVLLDSKALIQKETKTKEPSKVKQKKEKGDKKRPLFKPENKVAPETKKDRIDTATLLREVMPIPDPFSRDTSPQFPNSKPGASHSLPGGRNIAPMVKEKSDIPHETKEKDEGEKDEKIQKETSDETNTASEDNQTQVEENKETVTGKEDVQPPLPLYVTKENEQIDNIANELDERMKDPNYVPPPFQYIVPWQLRSNLDDINDGM